MAKENPVRDKSFLLAVRIVRLFKHLTEAKREYVLSKQLLRSGTSVGANIREALDGESTADFIHKLSIALKEISETLYWLDLLRATDFLTEAEHLSIFTDAEEVKKLLVKIIKTTKK